MLRVIPTALIVFLVFTGVSFADDVTDQIKLAKKAYKQNDYNKSMEALDTASILIRQKRSDSIEEILPESFSGWDAGRKKNEKLYGDADRLSHVHKRRGRGGGNCRYRLATDGPCKLAFCG